MTRLKCCLSFLIALFLISLSTTASRSSTDQKGIPPAVRDTAKAHIAILGMFHFVSKSNTFEQNFDASEVMTPQRQHEIKMLVDSLADFKPAKIAMERPYYSMQELNDKYQQYLNGKYKLRAEETDQIAFRLGKMLGHDSLYLAKTTYNEFNIKPVQQYAQKNNQMHILRQTRTTATNLLSKLDSTLAAGTVIDGIQYFNSNSVLEKNYQTYKMFTRIGERGNQVGADLMASWQRQNLRIYSNIRDISESGERLLVIYGMGHVRELQRYIRENPNLNHINIKPYL